MNAGMFEPAEVYRRWSDGPPARPESRLGLGERERERERGICVPSVVAYGPPTDQVRVDTSVEHGPQSGKVTGNGRRLGES